MPKVISIDDIQNGMVSAEPIVNRYGQIILAAGTSLTSRHSSMLRAWNVRTVKIVGGDEVADIGVSDEIKQLALDKIKKRLTWSPRLPIEEDLLAISIKHIALSILNKGRQEKSQ